MKQGRATYRVSATAIHGFVEGHCFVEGHSLTKTKDEGKKPASEAKQVYGREIPRTHLVLPDM